MLSGEYVPVGIGIFSILRFRYDNNIYDGRFLLFAKAPPPPLGGGGAHDRCSRVGVPPDSPPKPGSFGFCSS